MAKKLSNTKNRKWLLSLLFVFALSLAGWGIKVLTGSLIPLWLLLGFSVIHSIEKWLSFPTIRYKTVGRIYRLILNLSVLSLLGLLIWSGVLLFTQRFMQSPLVGSLLFVAEIAVFVWLCKVVSKNNWRQPSMRLTVISLICLFLIFSFAGVQPLADYKDAAIDRIRTIWPEYPALLTVVLVLAAIGLITLLVDAIRRRGSSYSTGRRGNSYSMKRTFLILLVIACIAVVVWVAYLLFTNQTDPVMGGIILAVDIGVLIWNISVLRAYRIGSGAVLAVFLVVALIAMTVSAFAGIEPFAGLMNRVMDSLPGSISRYDVAISSGQEKTVESWHIRLDGGGWNGGTATIRLTITNLGNRRCFGLCSLLDPGPELVAMDSTGKLVEPWVREPDFSRGELLVFPPYTKEFYPNETWSGTLKFELSPYSGKTWLYMTEYSHTRRYPLFDLGEPKR